MADISILSRLVNGIQRNVDLSANTLVTTSIKVGGGAGPELTSAILNNLIALQDGSDFSDGTNSHTHDGRYYTESELGDATASSGSDLIGDDNTYSNFTPAAATVKGALSGIDSALATAGGTAFSDAEFAIQDDGDNTKQILFQASGIATATSRTITMPDADVNLADVNQAILQDGSRAFTADQSMGGNKLTNLATPTADTDAATKAYVDAIKQGLDVKDSVRAATESNIANLATGAPNTVDGVSLSAGDRILVKSQSTGSENGIYVVDTVGTGSDGAWSRAADADEDSEVTAGLFTFVEEGTANADSGWILTTDDPITVGTTALTFTQFSGAGQITAGAGLTKSGNTLDVGDINRGIQVNADSLEIDGSEVASTGLEEDGTNSWQIRLAAQGNGIAGGNGSLLSVLADTTGGANLARAINVSANGVAVKIDDVTIGEDGSQQLEVKDNSLGAAKLTTGVADQDSITGGNGTALSVAHAPQINNDEVAGEAMPASGVRAVRYGIDTLDTPETAGRVYLADPTELSLVKSGGNQDPFHVIGLIIAASQSAADPVDVIKKGLITATSHGLTVGQPAYLDSSGALTSTPPSTTGEAVVKVGVPKDANTIDVNIQIMGVA